MPTCCRTPRDGVMCKLQTSLQVVPWITLMLCRKLFTANAQLRNVVCRTIIRVFGCCSWEFGFPFGSIGGGMAGTLGSQRLTKVRSRMPPGFACASVQWGRARSLAFVRPVSERPWRLANAYAICICIVAIGCSPRLGDRRPATVESIYTVAEVVRRSLDGQLPYRTFCNVNDVMTVGAGWLEGQEERYQRDGWGQPFAVSDTQCSDRTRVIVICSFGENVQSLSDDIVVAVIKPHDSPAFVIPSRR
jgi:hypothetical protein